MLADLCRKEAVKALWQVYWLSALSLTLFWFSKYSTSCIVCLVASNIGRKQNLSVENKLLQEADRRRKEPTDLLQGQSTGTSKAHLRIDSKPSYESLHLAMPPVLFCALSLFQCASICRLCL